MKGTLALALGCFGALSGAASFAEADRQPGGAEDEPGFLTVHAPRVLRRPTDQRARSNEELVYIAHRVSYAGLDLAMHADVLELRKRIVESANVACEQLAALSPLADLDTAACVRDAIDDAMERARAVVAAAMAAHEAD